MNHMYFSDIDNPLSNLNWAKFYVDLGRLFGREIIHSGQLHNLILRVPYTNYIAHFISLGIADEVYSNDNIELESDLSEKLIPGETVVYFKESDYSREKPYNFLGFNKYNNPIIQEMKRQKQKSSPMKIFLANDWREKVRVANENIQYKTVRTLNNDSLNKLKHYYSDENLEKLARLNNNKIIIIGNKNRLEKEADTVIQGLKLSNWLLMHHSLSLQSFYLSKVYSTQYQEKLEELPKGTVVIYTSLDSFYYFYDDLKGFSSIVLDSPVENNINEQQALEDIVELFGKYKYSELIDSALRSEHTKKVIPKGVEFGSWEVSV